GGLTESPSSHVSVAEIKLSISDSGFVSFAGTYAHRLLNRDNEDLAVANVASPSRRHDRVDGLVDYFGRHDDLDLEFREEGHSVFSAPIEFRMAPLPAVAFYFGHGHALQAKLGKSFTHLIHLEWLDDRHD